MLEAMKIDDAGLVHLAAFESCILRARWDENGYSIGFGHHDQSVNFDTTCTLSQATAWLLEDTDAISERLSELIETQLNQGQFNVMVIFAYNVGINAFASSHLLSGLNSGEFDSVPDQISRWVYANGQIDKGLVARRASEITLWNTASETQNSKASGSTQTEN